jgi:hypothetical protein
VLHSFMGRNDQGKLNPLPLPGAPMSLGLDTCSIRGTLLGIQSGDVSSSWYGEGG